MGTTQVAARARSATSDFALTSKHLREFDPKSFLATAGVVSAIATLIGLRSSKRAVESEVPVSEIDRYVAFRPL